MPGNHVTIKLHKFTFDVTPALAELRPGTPLELSVDWSDNQGQWSKVTVHQFRLITGAAVGCTPSSVEFTPAGGVQTKKIDFVYDVKPPAVAVRCKYDVSYERAKPSETFILDPEIDLKP